MTRRRCYQLGRGKEFFISLFLALPAGSTQKESSNTLSVPGRIYVGADHANVRKCSRVSGKRLNVLKADDQAIRIPFSHMEDASFWKAADKTSFLIDGQHPVQNHMVSRLNQWIQDPNNSFPILNSYRFDSNHLIHNVSLAGDFLGSLAPLHLKLHLASKPGGSLTGSLDSINQGAIAYDPALPASPIYLPTTSPPHSSVTPQPP